MNAYRVMEHQSEYTGKKKAWELYTHEDEFKKRLACVRTVDGIFRTCNPELCVDDMTVVKAFKAEEAKKLEEAEKRQGPQKGQK